jgi:hypothetical protein
MHALNESKSQRMFGRCTNYVGYTSFAGYALIALLCLGSGVSLGADNQPIERGIDDNKVMSRVQLVGVIADGSGTNKGIAVIKDTETGRSYAIKTGDSLPGVSHIVLTNVQRDGLEFKSTGQKYVVRPFINTDSTTKASELAAQNPADADQTTDQHDGPGLFEKWAVGATAGDAGGISPEALKTLQKKFESLGKEESNKDRMRADNARAETERVTSDSEDSVIFEEDFSEDF